MQIRGIHVNLWEPNQKQKLPAKWNAAKSPEVVAQLLFLFLVQGTLVPQLWKDSFDASKLNWKFEI